MLVKYITSVGKERAVYLLSFTRKFVFFCSKEFLRPLGAWERLCYIIVALLGPSINYFKFAAKIECVK